MPRRSPRKLSVTIASDAGVSTAAPAPTAASETISATAEPASAAGTEAAMYSSVPAVSTRTRSEHVGQPAGRDQQRRVRQQVAGDRPLELGQRRAGLPVQRRDREHDRGVCTDVIPLAGAIAMSSRQDPVFLPSSMPRTTYLQGRSGCESAKAGCEPGR